VNVNQRRYAIASALAASAVPSLVLARGHRIENLLEVPLVVSGAEAISKTKEAVSVLKALGAHSDVERAKDSKTLRAGKGKMRNRRYVVRRGPLVVYAEQSGLEKAFRNLPGVDIVHVDRLNLLQLAPGGHLGRFVIWTQGAFERLEQLFGSVTATSALKKGYTLPRAPVTTADLARLINSNEVQSVIRPAVKDRTWSRQKKNPLTNVKAMIKLNPYAKVVKQSEAAAQKKRESGKKEKKARISSARRSTSQAFYRSLKSEEFIRPTEA
jgi:large subunit ribosomal protein L4e